MARKNSKESSGFGIFAVDARLFTTLSEFNTKPFGAAQRFHLALIQNAVETIYIYLDKKRRGIDPSRSHEEITKEDVDRAISWIDGCEDVDEEYYYTHQKHILRHPDDPVPNHCYISRPGFISFDSCCEATFLEPSYFRERLREELREFVRKYPYVLERKDNE